MTAWDMTDRRRPTLADSRARKARVELSRRHAQGISTLTAACGKARGMPPATPGLAMSSRRDAPHAPKTSAAPCPG